MLEGCRSDLISISARARGGRGSCSFETGRLRFFRVGALGDKGGKGERERLVKQGNSILTRVLNPQAFQFYMVTINSHDFFFFSFLFLFSRCKHDLHSVVFSFTTV